MSFLSSLAWRYATKSFDPTRTVSDTDLQKILEAIRMAPTSFGLQPLHVHIVKNVDIKEKLQAAAFGQPQIGTASHVIVLSARSDLETLKEEFFNSLSNGDANIRASLAGFEQYVSNFIAGKQTEAEALAWAKPQAYINLGFGLAAAAELMIDSCPMEGFDPEAVKNILEMDDSLAPTLLLPIGYRPTDAEIRPKNRFSEEALFTYIN